MYALIINDENGHEVVSHVSNNNDNTVFVPDFDLPQYEWRKAYHLTEWVKKNKPSWKIYEKQFEIFERNNQIVFANK